MLVTRQGPLRTYTRPANSRNTANVDRSYRGGVSLPAGGLTVQCERGFPAPHPHTGMGPMQRSVSVTNMGEERRLTAPPERWAARAWAPMTPSLADLLERAGATPGTQVRHRGHTAGIGNPFSKSQLLPPGPAHSLTPTSRTATGLTPPATPVAASHHASRLQRPRGLAGFPTGGERIAPRGHCAVTHARDVDAPRGRDPGFLAVPAPPSAFGERSRASQWTPRPSFLNGYADGGER